MFSYFVVVSYPHWFKFCQKCDIKYRIHNYHFFHTFVENPLMLHGLPEIWHIFGCQFGLCTFMYNFLVNSLVLLWIHTYMFPMKMRRKEWTECQHTRRIWHVMILLLEKQIDMSEGFFFDEEENEYICTGFRKRMALMWNFWIKTLPTTFQLDMIAHIVSIINFVLAYQGKSML